MLFGVKYALTNFTYDFPIGRCSYGPESDLTDDAHIQERLRLHCLEGQTGV